MTPPFDSPWFLPLFCATLFSVVPLQAAPVLGDIGLSTPVSDSVETITGIYWAANTVTGESLNNTPDSSGNNYTGTLRVGSGGSGPLPTLTGGVDRAGTSGYGNGISLASDYSTATNRNPMIYRPSNSPELAMDDTDFTGGAWLSFNSLQTGFQQVMIMDRGAQNASAASYGGGWSFFLEKDALGMWRIGFTVRDNTASTTIYTAYGDWELELEEWYHFGFSYEYHSAENNLVTFWKDGVALDTVSLDRNITAGTPDTLGTYFSVGERSASSYSSIFDGSVDDIFVTEGRYSVSPVPEPGAVLMFGVGAGLAFSLRRRNRRVA